MIYKVEILKLDRNEKSANSLQSSSPKPCSFEKEESGKNKVDGTSCAEAMFGCNGKLKFCYSEFKFSFHKTHQSPH